MKIKLKKDHPLTLGMPGSIGVFYRGQPAFRTSVPNFDMDCHECMAKFSAKMKDACPEWDKECKMES